MSTGTTEHEVTSSEALEALYGLPGPVARVKEIDQISAHYRAFIEHASFVVLATSGPDGLDCSPRGDHPGFVRVQDNKTLLIPDRPGNNRLDSLHNLVHDARIALLFLIPGIGETLRVIGRGRISIDPQLTQSFVVNGKMPRSVIAISVESVYFQCCKAIVRSRLWDHGSKIERHRLPSAGTMLAALTNGNIAGDAYDCEQPNRIKRQLY
jgi:uncharacterized protein